MKPLHAVALTILIAAALFIFSNKKSSKTKFCTGQTFCVVNPITQQQFNAKIHFAFSFEGQDAYVAGPDQPGAPLQWLSVIGNDVVEYWLDNCHQ